jgi:hypothetical protein
MKNKYLPSFAGLLIIGTLLAASGSNAAASIASSASSAHAAGIAGIAEINGNREFAIITDRQEIASAISINSCDEITIAESDIRDTSSIAIRSTIDQIQDNQIDGNIMEIESAA